MRFLVLLTLLLTSPAAAQKEDVQQNEGPKSDDGWFAVLTPQIWFSHIDKNGFSAPPPLVVPRGVATNPHQFAMTSQSESAVDPQWGASALFGWQSRAWTLGVAAQYVSFETRNNITAKGSSITGLIVPAFSELTFPVTPGQQIVQERVNSDRFDVDLALMYFVSDVIKDRFNLSAGLGLKSIYVSATGQFLNRISIGENSASQQFLYAKCNDLATSCRLVAKASVDDLFYGATIPLNFAFCPVRDK